MVRASQSTLQNLDVLVKRLDDIVSFVQSGQGSIGKIIYDPALFNRADATIAQLQQIANRTQLAAKAPSASCWNSDELYNKLNTSVDNVNHIIDDVNGGKGTIGKFLKDPSLYDNANKMVANGNQVD